MAKLTNEIQATMNVYVERAKLLGVETIRLSDLQRREGLNEVTSSKLEAAAKALKTKKLIKKYEDGILYVS